ncbi:uncharacterized protein EV420DRAFT_1714433 [Desarmillaria tabescens]|uniref:Uncharacterized protein n=1 Tax=Armillaria tabescens TaxID=1929756 RepID=A0AA39JSD6_ARMTA|nr:uncharacterized protein EV420DRAFT_1714433 [Desarmillaria tabescens]KAK0446966.1 hypothetical protein EV420DRAFT_1714433 [Desarmillaria tabescens]
MTSVKHRNKIMSAGSVATSSRSEHAPPDLIQRSMVTNDAACEGEVLRTHWEWKNHSAIVVRVTACRNNIPIVPSHAPPIHPFDSHRSLLAILNNKPYVPGEIPKDAPTLRTGEYIRWFLLTLLGNFRYDDRKAWEEREVFWRRVQLQHDPHTEPDDWEDFMRSRRDEKTQNCRASRDRQTNTIYDNMASVSPSGLTTTTPNLSPQPHHWHEAFQAASPTLYPPFSILDTGYSVGFLLPR